MATRVRRLPSLPRALTAILVVASLVKCQILMNDGADMNEQQQQQQCASSEGVAGSSSTCLSDRVDDNDTNPSDADDGWNPQQFWDGSRDIFQRIFGTTTPSEEEEGGDVGGDPFYNLAEGKHDHDAPASSPQGFFDKLWAGVQKSAQETSDAELKEDEQPSDVVRALQSLFGSNQKNEEVPGNKEHSKWEDVLLTHFKTSKQTMLEDSVGIKMERFKKTFAEMSDQLKRTFANVPIDKLNLLQVYYAMQHEESIKDPVWKRRQHRSLPDLKEKEAIALFDGMYLSYLSYVETCADVHQGLHDFYNGSWVLVNCTTVGQPLRPAHFLAVKRQTKDQQPPEASAGGSDFWQPLLGGGKGARKELEVVLVIRGTKEMGDAFSDALLEPTEYLDGHAHDGILKSARWIHDTYREWIMHLQKVSKSTHVRLWLVGHSLGAGTAALASMEFNGVKASTTSTQPNGVLEAHALGFGTPAVLSQNLSESVQQYVTTVVADADCVPRMSGATLANGLLRILQYNWTDDALDDLRDAMIAFKDGAPKPFADAFMTEAMGESFVAWVSSVLNSMTRDLPTFDPALLADPVLVPPGDCIHLYRDGVDWRGSYVPCRRFDQLEAVRTLVDDHLIDTGYYVGLLGFVRAIKKDLNWQFAHDLLKLPVR